MTKKTKNSNWPRITIQWGVILTVIVLALMPKFNQNFKPDFEAYCPFGGIQALGSYLLNQSLSCTMTSAQIVMGILLIVSVFVFSKLFCGYLCPIGTFSEWLGKLGDKLKVRVTIKGILDQILRSLKYILLFITLYFTLGSNELFCKKFDPYFAVTSGFNTDVVILYAIIAIVLVVLGSVFIRLFWCKYICPLGALSNIFKFTGFFVVIMVVYLVLLKFGVQVSYVWPLAIACTGGYILELTGKQWKLFPLFKITRNENTCINCQLCTRKCPQAIDVANLKVVNHSDCNLCGECIDVCPVENTVQINKKKKLRHLPSIVVVLLIIFGIFIGSKWEVPTIDQRWYDQEVMAKAETFSRSDLKNIKCYGSSMAFASKMKKINGILGVATYVKHHKVKVYYDPSLISEEQIQEQLFSPSKNIIRPLRKEVTEVQELTFWLENFFDSYDFSYLTRLLASETEAVGLLSEYDCPVKVKIYFPANVDIDIDELIKILESETLTYQVKDRLITVDLDYKVAKKSMSAKLKQASYAELMYTPFQTRFNKFKSYDSSVVKKIQFPLGENKAFKNKLNYLVSHLSNDDGIIEVGTYLDSSSVEMLTISFVDSMTNKEAVIQSMKSDTLVITYTTGKTGKIANMFNFKDVQIP